MTILQIILIKKVKIIYILYIKISIFDIKKNSFCILLIRTFQSCMIIYKTHSKQITCKKHIFLFIVYKAFLVL